MPNLNVKCSLTRASGHPPEAVQCDKHMTLALAALAALAATATGDAGAVEHHRHKQVHPATNELEAGPSSGSCRGCWGCEAAQQCADTPAQLQRRCIEPLEASWELGCLLPSPPLLQVYDEAPEGGHSRALHI